MGMGKTLTTLAHIALHLPEGPNLIVCSKTVLLTWIEEIKKFFPPDSMPYVIIHSEYTDEDEINVETLRDAFVVLTTYDTVLHTARKFGITDDILVKDNLTGIKHLYKPSYRIIEDVKGHRSLFHTPWKRLIADESQKFANPTSKTFYAMFSLPGEYRWCLTGTPIRNFATDLYSQMRFSGMNYLTSKLKFTQRTYRALRLDQKILSMTYEDAGIVLPKVHRHIELFELNEMNREVYEYYLAQVKSLYEEFMFDGNLTFACILVLFLRLRQVCIAPYLATKESKRGHVKTENQEVLDKILDEMSSGMHSWMHNRKEDAGINAPKIRKILGIIRNITHRGEKIIVFSMFTNCMDMIREAVESDEDLSRIKIAQIDGSVTGKDRQDQLDFFRNIEDVQILFITYKTGSEGLNLIQATNVLLVEPWWSPAIHEQAMARIHRTGQTKEVHFWTVIARNTIEERILAICEQKYNTMKNFLGDKHTLSNGIKMDSSMLRDILDI